MRRFVWILFLGCSSFAQEKEWDCTNMSVTQTNHPAPPSCTWGTNYQMTWTINLTGYHNGVAISPQQNVEATGTGACGYSGCTPTIYPIVNETWISSTANWSYQSQLTNYAATVNNGVVSGCGETGTTVTPTAFMQIPGCVCTVSTCYGQPDGNPKWSWCPSCTCPTPNSACSGLGAGNKPCLLQNVCEYGAGPPNNGCNYPSYVLNTVGGLPCCTPTATPIVIDVDGSGFHLTSSEEGVTFDFSGNGHPLRMAWIAPTSTNAWLVRDLYGTGKIINGSEMFGNLTEQPESPDPNGFAALAQCDDNHDGWIDEADAIWPALLLWQDLNHNGISEPGELKSLATYGIKRIAVNYRLSRKADKYGNEFRYRGRINDESSDRFTYDVVLTYDTERR